MVVAEGILRLVFNDVLSTHDAAWGLFWLNHVASENSIDCLCHTMR